MREKRFFRIILCLLLLFPLVAGNGTAAEPPRPLSEGGCNLPAPGNVHTTAVGSTTATLAWNAVSGAWGYKVTLSANGAPASASGTTTATSMMLSGLTPGVEYTATVYAMCTLYDQSPNGGSTQFVTSIIVELICEATSTGNPQGYVSGSGTLYPYNWGNEEGYYVWLTYGNNTGKFKFYRTSGSASFIIRPMSGNPSGFSLGRNNPEDNSLEYCGESGSNGLTGAFHVKYNNTVLLHAYFPRDNQLNVEVLSNALIQVRKDTPNAQEIDPDRSEMPLATASTLPVPQPNPFTDQLYLNGGPTEVPVQCVLFDAGGQLVRQFDYAGAGQDGERPAVPTADLPPGVYFLQVRTPSANTTYKLLKM